MSTLIERKTITNEQDSMMHMQSVKPNVDLRQVTVLTGKDWQRIQEEIHWKEIETEKIRRWKEKKERLKEKSQNIMKNWPNSLMNLRQKKLDAIKKKKETAEEHKKERDLEWAEYQAGLRKEIIEKAKEKQYYQTERIRNLHSAYLLSEVTKEREEQIKLKHILAENDQIRDKKWADKERKENEQIMQIEERKILEIRQKLIKNSEFIQNQIGRTSDLKEKEKEKLRKEQLELNKLADEWRHENEEKKRLLHEKIKKNAVENRKQMEENEHIRELEDQLEEEDDKQCRIYADAKRKLMKLRTTREKEMAAERQKHLEYIVDKLSKNMKKNKDDEDERIAKAVAEMDAKKKSEEEEKERKRKEIITQCMKHLKEKIIDGEKKKLELSQAEREELKASMEADAICHKNDNEKKVKIKQDKLALREYHKLQIDHKKEAKEEYEELERKMKHTAEKLEKQEEQRFHLYANDLIKQCAQKGRNVYPLVAAARQKSAPVPSIQRNSDDDENNNSKDRKKLGFIW